jgi:hypothetical protein
MGVDHTSIGSGAGLRCRFKIIGEDGATSCLWQYEDSNGTPHFSSQATPFNMSGKNNVVVTVTGSNGNIAVFTPAKNCPSPFSWTNYLWLALAVVLFGALIWGGANRR